MSDGVITVEGLYGDDVTVHAFRDQVVIGVSDGLDDVPIEAHLTPAQAMSLARHLFTLAEKASSWKGERE